MKRRDVTLGLAAAGLVVPPAWAQGGPVEGRQYQRLAQTLPGTPGRIEVLEFFFYRCPHCYALDPLVENWVHQLPADVTFKRIHVGGQAMLNVHQRMFFALDAMGALTPAVHAGIFNAFHRQGVEVTDEAGAVALVGRLGVDAAKFKQTFNAFGVQTKVAQAKKLAEACGVETVPALVVGGRWRTGPGMGAAPGSEQLHGQQALAVVDALIKMARSGKVS